MIAFVFNAALANPPAWPGGTWLTVQHEGDTLSCLVVPEADAAAVRAEIVARGLQGRWRLESAPITGDTRSRIESALWRQAAADRQANDNAAVAASLDAYLSLLGDA